MIDTTTRIPRVFLIPAPGRIAAGRGCAELPRRRPVSGARTRSNRGRWPPPHQAAKRRRAGRIPPPGGHSRRVARDRCRSFWAISSKPVSHALDELMSRSACSSLYEHLVDLPAPARAEADVAGSAGLHARPHPTVVLPSCDHPGRASPPILMRPVDDTALASTRRRRKKRRYRLRRDPPLEGDVMLCTTRASDREARRTTKALGPAAPRCRRPGCTSRPLPLDLSLRMPLERQRRGPIPLDHRGVARARPRLLSRLSAARRDDRRRGQRGGRTSTATRVTLIGAPGAAHVARGRVARRARRCARARVVGAAQR